MSKQTITPVATLVGAALAGGLSVAHAAATDATVDELFTATQIEGGYLQIASEGSCGAKGEGEGKCGEGKCGEGKCGDEKEEG